MTLKVRISNFPDQSLPFPLPSAFVKPQKAKQIALRKANLARPQIVGSGSNIPHQTTPGATTEILYHQLQINMTSPTGPYSEYLSGSGINRSQSIDDFMTALENGTQTVDRPLYNMLSDAPNIVVRNPCFIVIQLIGSTNIRFQPDAEPIKTQDDYSSTFKYCNMVCYDTSWDPQPDTTPVDDACYLIYFECQEVDPPDADYFSLCLQVGNDGSGPDYLTIDPAIKNRGPKKLVAAAA
ncbi:MAG TPA: nucleotide synthetase [Rhizomicrobium sp.]|jgi:hypothetical protein|nr:nucleotide synthetase [Rhizomicrobium sp.]